MALPPDSIESKRLDLQTELDGLKTAAERNRLGQFATPTPLARNILDYAQTLLPGNEPIRLLDPAFGTGSFYSALQAVFPSGRIAEARGFEIDNHYGLPAEKLWRDSGLILERADFTKAEPSPRFNLVICNPPYVRHHHLKNGEKERLQMKTRDASGMRLGGLAGLYCHFLGLTHAWMTPGAIAGWLIPSEFMDVNYGRVVKQYLLDRVTLLRIHRFDPAEVQFADALVSSAVVWFRNTPPRENLSVEFTLGGSLFKPRIAKTVTAKTLCDEGKWTRFPSSGRREISSGPTLSDFFQIKRGIATGDNAFFVLSSEEIAKRKLPRKLFRPILPSPRYLPADEVHADPQGNPVLDRRLFLLDTRLPQDEIKIRYPALSAYLEEGRGDAIHERYICSHRSPWYAQEVRPPAPIVCTYLGRENGKRGHPFRFIRNHSQATVANVYLAMYPTPLLARAVAEDASLLQSIWKILNDLRPDQLLDEGRVYGGGLHKLEPKELGSVNADSIAALLPSFQPIPKTQQLEIFA